MKINRALNERFKAYMQLRTSYDFSVDITSKMTTFYQMDRKGAFLVSQ